MFRILLHQPTGHARTYALYGSKTRQIYEIPIRKANFLVEKSALGQCPTNFSTLLPPPSLRTPEHHEHPVCVCSFVQKITLRSKKYVKILDFCFFMLYICTGNSPQPCYANRHITMRSTQA